MKKPSDTLVPLSSDFDGEVPVIDLGLPKLDLVPIACLRIDEQYQRNISRRSAKIIRVMMSDFHWSRFGIVTVTPVDDGTFAILDGQHRATALKALGAEFCPCLITSQDDVQAQARDFMGINTARTALHASQAYKARLTAAEPIIVSLDAAMTKAGLRLLTYQKTADAFKVGDCIAWGKTEKLFRQDRALFSRVCKILAAAKLTPVKAAQLQCVWDLLTDPLYSQNLDDAALASVIGSKLHTDWLSDARRRQSVTGDPTVTCLTHVYWVAMKAAHP